MPTAPTPAADGERILLLECRLEQLRSALDEARADADGVRVKLADAAAREADHARRYAVIQQELAEARAEMVSLHERLDRSEALRAEMEGHLFEAGAHGDAAELVRLRREVLAQRQRSSINERTCARLRARVDELLLSRETLLTRVAEWQRLVQKEGPAAADLAEFMAELRGDILHLEHRNAAGERQQAALRDRLVRAGLDPDAQATEDVPAALFESASDHESAPEFLPLEGDVVDAAASTNNGEPATAQPPVASTIENTNVASAAAEETEGADLDGAVATTTGASSPRRAEAGRGVRAQRMNAGRASIEPIDAVASEATDEDGTDSSDAPPATRAQPADAGPYAGPDAGPDADDVGADADAPATSHTDAVPAAPEHEDPTGDAAVPPVEGLHASDPSARAAAYERLTRVLDGDPTRLAYHLRPGLADPHPRVRRRAVLAAATAQQVRLHPLLEPLQGDPDPHVRRVVREVLRHASRAELRAEEDDDAAPASARAVSETRP